MGHLFCRPCVCRGLVLESKKLIPPRAQELRHSLVIATCLYRALIKSGTIDLTNPKHAQETTRLLHSYLVRQKQQHAFEWEVMSWMK